MLQPIAGRVAVVTGGSRKLGELVACCGEHLGEPFAADSHAFLGQRVEGSLREPVVALGLVDRDQARVAQPLDRLVEGRSLADIHGAVLAPGPHPALDRVGVKGTSTQHPEHGEVQRRRPDFPFHLLPV